LCEHLGYEFSRAELLWEAVSHRSWCAENPGQSSNERLEFLGDAVLGWVVADFVFRHYPLLPEGRLTEVRKAVVNAAALAEVAESIELGSSIWLGKGESLAGGSKKPSILSDAFEAVIGAVYLDGGVDAVAAMIVRLIGPRIEAAVAGDGHVDHKTLLQELTARRFEAAPTYGHTEEGPDHAKRFRAEVFVNGVIYGFGEGRSKKIAEQAAASQAMEALRDTDA
jgi:ribonuclease-3